MPRYASRPGGRAEGSPGAASYRWENEGLGQGVAEGWGCRWDQTGGRPDPSLPPEPPPPLHPLQPSPLHPESWIL